MNDQHQYILLINITTYKGLQRGVQLRVRAYLTTNGNSWHATRISRAVDRRALDHLNRLAFSS